MTSEETAEVYKNLTEANDAPKSKDVTKTTTTLLVILVFLFYLTFFCIHSNDFSPLKRWNAYLLLCCFTASMASFTFGYNIGATNLPTPVSAVNSPFNTLFY